MQDPYPYPFFYLVFYLISLSMARVRRSNRALKPRVYWDPTISPPRQKQPPAFIILHWTSWRPQHPALRLPKHPASWMPNQRPNWRHNWRSKHPSLWQRPKHPARNQLNWQSKYQQRSFGANITNIGGGLRGCSGSWFRGSRTRWRCDQCNTRLCKIGDCWRL